MPKGTRLRSSGFPSKPIPAGGSWQVSWLMLSRTGRLPIPTIRTVAHVPNPTQSQWRGRAGFSPDFPNAVAGTRNETSVGGCAGGSQAAGRGEAEEAREVEEAEGRRMPRAFIRARTAATGPVWSHSRTARHCGPDSDGVVAPRRVCWTAKLCAGDLGCRPTAACFSSTSFASSTLLPPADRPPRPRAERAMDTQAAGAKFWGGRRGSNPRHPEPQSGALPAELRPPYNQKYCKHYRDALAGRSNAGPSRYFPACSFA